MRSYRGDLIAIAAIVAGTLGSAVLYHRMSWGHSETIRTVERPSNLTVARPGHARAQRLPGSSVLRFRVAEPAGEVYLARAGKADLPITAGTELTLEDGLFDGSFRTHGMPRQIRLAVEVVKGDQVTSSGTVSSLRPHIDVTKGGITIFGF